MRIFVAFALLITIGHWSNPTESQAQQPSAASQAAKRLLADMPAIEGPTVVAPYKIVRLKAVNLPAKAGVLWEVDPEDAPLDYATNPTRDRLEFVAPPGKYTCRVLVIQMSEDGVILPFKLRHTVTIGKPGPGPGPDPGPTPDPDPPGPTPGPVPIPVDGFRVIMIYETAEISKLPKEQNSILFSKKLRDYMDSKCATGPDGKTKEWRIWDKDVDTTNESKIWQDVMKRQKDSVPWIVISTGKTGFEGKLPANVDETLKLLKKYGGE